MTVIDTTRTAWNNAAEGWNRHAPEIRTWLRTPTAMKIDLAGIRPGHAVLDLATRAGPIGQITAIDISATIPAFAADAARAASHRNVKTLTDIAHLPLAGARSDAAVCRLGLMFLPDPLKDLRETHRTPQPGARLCAVVFAAPI